MGRYEDRLAPPLRERGQAGRGGRRFTTAEATDFAAVDEPGVEALVGTYDDNLIPVGGDAMMYGDGGVGKTTLAIDLAVHVAAGADWLGMTTRPSRVLLIENEGPRPLFRAKLRRKLAAFDRELFGRLHVLDGPWAELDLAGEDDRDELASLIVEHEIELVIAGPLTRLGMNEAGTLQEVRDFGELVRDVRARAHRPVAFVFVHHENKSGRVSGAWEPAGDTLLHVQGQGHGRTRLFVQKARWSSTMHARTFHLRWADGEAFEVDDAPPVDERIRDALTRFALEQPGCSWAAMREGTPGSTELKMRYRDALLKEGELVNASEAAGRFALWHVDDPARPHRFDDDAGVSQSRARAAELELDELVERAKRNAENNRPVQPDGKTDGLPSGRPDDAGR